MSDPHQTLAPAPAARATPAARSGSTARWLWLAGMAVCATLVYRDLFAWALLETRHEDFEDVFFEPGESTPELIFGLAAMMLWGRRRAFLGAARSGPASPALGVPLLLGAALTSTWARYVDAPELGLFSLAFALLGGAAALGGLAATRVMLVPALFVLLALPIPTAITNQIVFPLQLTTAALSDRLLDLLGIRSVLVGEQIRTPGAVFLVIETCSGLTSIRTMVMASVVYLELFYRSRSQALILLIAAPLLAFATNLLRVVTIALNPHSDVVAIHTLQGIVALVVTVCLLRGLDLLLGALLGWAPSGRRTVRPTVTASGAASWPARLAVLAVLAVAAAARIGLEPWAAPTRSPKPYVRLPETMDGWQFRNLKNDSQFLGSVKFIDRSFRSYTRGDDEVHVFVGLDDRLESRRSAISAKNRFPGTGYRVQSRRRLTPAAGLREVEELEIQSVTEKRLVHYWTRGIASPSVEAVRALLHLDRGPLRRDEDVVVFRMSAKIEDGDVDAARRLLARFEPLILEQLTIIPAREAVSRSP